MPQQNGQQDSWKELVGNAAARFVEDGMVIGLGTGTTSTYLVQALAQRVKEGLHVVGAISSSQITQDLAGQLGIPLTTLDQHPTLDLYIDGADEIDPQIRLIKGAGGALLREKILASCARRFIVIADITKQVAFLGQHFPVPVEVVPFALTPVSRQLETLGANVRLRKREERTFITDNYNLILDCTFPQGISNPGELDAQLHSIVGVVETGLFLHMASLALIAGPRGIQTLS